MLSVLTRFQDKKTYPFVLVLLSGVLLGLSWYSPFAFLTFIGFVPVLLLDSHFDQVKKRGGLKMFLFLYVSFFIWNYISYWWLWNASGVGTFGAWGFNSLFQTIPFLFFRFTRKMVNEKVGYLSLPFYWLTFEYGHFNWDLSWVWLHVGHVFHSQTQWIQWYEYTGVLGGSFWVILANIAVYFYVKNEIKIVIPSLVIFVPIVISYVIFFTYEEKGRSIEAVVIQPNLNAYTQKFAYNAKTGEDNGESFVPLSKQIDRFIKLSDSLTTENTEFVAWPETAIHENINVAEVEGDKNIIHASTFLVDHPNISILSGVDSYQLYESSKEGTKDVKFSERAGKYYDKYGSSVWLQKDVYPRFHHKSKLVPGAELMPFSWLKMIMDPSLFNTLSRTDNPQIFTTKQGTKVAPVICYESVYGEYLGEQIRNGAEVIAVVTNDDWWEDTPGHTQHYDFSKLRAIELRRPTVRSGNTGISAFINAKGEVLSETKYRQRDALRGTVITNSKITLYALAGDYLGRLAGFMSAILILSAFVRSRVRHSVLFR